MKTKLLIIFTLLWSIAGFSQTFPFGNLNYEIIDADLKTVRIIGGSNLLSDLRIPEIVADTVNSGGVFTVTAIGRNAFREEGLTSVSIPNSVTVIQSDAFFNNEFISVTLPSSVLFIGDRAFAENTELESIISEGTVPATIQANSFGNRSNMDLFLPDDTFDLYANANWNGFRSVNPIFPSLQCQNVTLQLDENGELVLTEAVINLGSENNAPTNIVTIVPDVLDCSNIGDNEITLTLTNVIGNTTNCTAIVTIEDTLAPTIQCRDLSIQLDDNNRATLAVEDLLIDSVDNCTVDTINIDQSAFGLADIGENEVTLTITDTSGNVASCVATVTVTANDFPFAICQEIAIVLDASGQVTISGIDVDGGSTDAVGIDSFAVTPDTFDCSNVGDNEVVLTVTNTRGNSSTCTAIVTVEEETLPTINCPADIIQDCAGFITYPQPTFSDDCSAFPEVPATVDGFALLGALGNSTYFISEDPVSAAQAFADAEERRFDIVTINNQEENEFIRAQIGALGLGAVLIGYNDRITEGVFEWQSGQPASFTNFREGEPNNVGDEDVVILIAESGLWNDIPQNNSSRLYIIEFHDYASGEPVFISGIPSGGLFTNGTVVNTFYVEDRFGNGSTCSFTVQINDTTAPDLFCGRAITVANDPGVCEASVTVPAPSFIDECTGGLIPDTFNVKYVFNSFLGELQNTPSTLKNVSTSTKDVELELIFNGDHDAIAESFVLVGPDSSVVFSGSDFDPVCEDVRRTIIVPQDTWNNWITVFGNDLVFTLQGDTDVDSGQCTSETGDFYRLRLPEFGQISLSNDFTGTLDATAQYPVGITTVTWTATDLTGNSATCTQTITVNDTEAPNVLCQNSTIRLDATGQVTITAADIDAGSTDNCAIDIISVSPDTFTIDELGDNEVTLTITDPSGNEASCTAIVTVVNDNFPVAVCQDITVQLDENGTVTIAAEDVDGGSSDSVGIDTIAVTPSSFNCSNIGENTVTLTVTNTLGNSISCEAIVTVEDVTPPVITCPSDITISNDTGLCEAEVVVPSVSEVADACSNLSIMPDTGMVSYLFDNEGLIDTPAVLSGVSAASEDVILKLNFSGDHNASGDEFRLNGPDNSLIFGEADIDPVCVLTERLIVIPQATWNTWITTFGTDLTFTLLRDVSVESDQCDVNEDFYRLRLPQFGNISVINDYTGTADASGVYTLGSTEILWTVEDLAGNVTTCIQTITVNEGATSITCPADQTVASDEGTTTYLLPDYFATGEVTAKGTCADPLVTFTQDPLPGTLVQEGTSTVTLCASDELGNEICCSFELTVDPTLSTEEFELFAGVSLYPNPVIDVLHVTNPDRTTLKRIEVYDINGRLVLASANEGANENLQIDVAKLESGPYFVRLQGEEGSITKQLIKR
ncbi:HYR domain-containing protein [Aquimarina sp. SS2-1]|uniref:HYR domain-containing protein n=1 Tax=Aquimarina besae TaxID=3342247 RepID=UPI0036713DF1